MKLPISKIVICCDCEDMALIVTKDAIITTTRANPIATRLNACTHQRKSRTEGVPDLGAGAIFPIAESDIIVKDFPIPEYWPRSYGMDTGWNWTAAVWGA